MTKNLAVVIVTYNRCELLQQSLNALAQQTFPIDNVIVVNNASTDGITEPFLDNYPSGQVGYLTVHTIHNPENTGGAGGFYTGLKYAHEQGYEWIFIMDDDVFAHPDCVKNLMDVAHPCMIAVREYKDGQIVERAAIEYNLANPFYLNPKRLAICDKYSQRSQMPATLEVDNVAFEGFMLKKDVIDKIGYPEPQYFIFYDDVDYALRARQAGFSILAVRDAVLVRQLPFDQAGAIGSWKAFYMFRNLFHIHQKFGENFWVRHKPYVLVIGAMITYGVKLKSWQVVRDIWLAFRTYKKLDKKPQ